MTDVSSGCPLSLQTSASMTTEVRRRSVPSTSFPVHCSLTGISSGTVQVKVKFTLEQATRGPEGEQMYSSTLPSTSALDGGGWSAPRPGRFTPGKDSVRIVKEAGWAPEPVWAGAENLAPTGIRSPDRTARSKSLYRLSYAGPLLQD